MVEQLNAIARLWWDWSAAMFWQAGLLIILIGCVDLLIRRWAWPQLRYALWSLILIKLLLPPTLSLPSGIVPELRPVVGQAFHLMDTDKAAAAESSAVIADFGLQIADLTHDIDLQPGSVNLQSAGLDISDGESEVSDSIVAANPPFEIRTPQLTWQFHAMLVWLAGTLILGIWLFLRLHSLCSRQGYQAAAASLPQSFYNRMADCANRLGLRHIPRVVVTKRLASPAVFGAIRPVLLMPKGCLSKLSRRDTEHMLLHELAHVKRGDLVMHSLYMLLQIAYWYNPLLWLVRRQMHHLRELSCDATVANLLRERTTAYRQTLLETARRLLTTSVEPGLGLLGLFEDSNRLLVRLNWLTKPTWRYRTMKRAIVVTIAALMVICVLPMAQARQSASNEVKDVTHDEIIRVGTEERSQPSQDQLSQELKAVQKHLDQMMAQQKELQNQLRALAERRRAMSQRREGGQEYGDQDLASLQKHLDEMTIQQRELQNQLRALARERQPLAEGRRGRQRDPADGRGGGPRRERVEVEQDIDVTVSPRESPDRPRPKREALESADQAKREGQERERARAETERALDEAKRAAGEAQKAQAQVQRQYADRMNAWGAEMSQWQQSEQMQQWRRQMENWQKQMQEWAQSLAHEQVNVEGESPDVVQPAPMPPMPPMPEMPKMPAPTKREMKMQYKGGDPMHGGVERTYKEGLRDIYGDDMPPVDAPAMEPPMPPAPPEVPQDAGDLQEVVHHSGFGPIPGDRFLDVENHVGSITVRSGDAPEYVIRATIKGRAETEERAHEIAERLVITDTGPQDDGRERIIVSKPEGLKDRESCVVVMEVTAPRNARLKLRQEVGDIRLANLRGSVEASDRVGSIRATDVSGQVALNVEVGGIDFTAPKDLSAKVQAKADLGGIQSDLPLEFTKAQGPAMGSKASGTIGEGEGNVSLKTNMGSIRIRSQASEPGRAERGRREPRPEPRPEGEF
jgi:beta-lactamase regulating signal transducer with metallopeptidase domain